MNDLPMGTKPHQYWEYEKQEFQKVDGGVIDETHVTIYVNGQELATVMCSPIDREALVLGFLHNEGIIKSMDEISFIQPNLPQSVIDVFLNHTDFEPPRKMILTSGCGGGVTLQQLTESYPALKSDFSVRPESISGRMRDMQSKSRLYQAVRGVHIAALCSSDALLISAEDVGRHNTIDKVMGKALLAKLSLEDKILITSGRISSEMVSKARRMNISIVASRTAPTSITIRLAEAWGICVIGYVRRGTMRVYTHPKRLGMAITESI